MEHWEKPWRLRQIKRCKTMEAYKSVFVICRNGSRIDDGENYAAHGSVGV